MANSAIDRVDDQQGRYDDDKVREAISLAESIQNNRTATVVFSARFNYLTTPLVVSGNVSMVSEGEGRRATTLRFTHGIHDGVDLVRFREGLEISIPGTHFIVCQEGSHAGEVPTPVQP